MKQITATQSYRKQIKELQSLRLKMIYRLKNGKGYKSIPFPMHSTSTGDWADWWTVSCSWENVAKIEARINRLSHTGFVMYK